MKRIGLYWFRHDLRLVDNPALSNLAQCCDRLLPVYILDPADLRQTVYQSRPLGFARFRFLRESLSALDAALARQGQKLLFCHGNPLEVLPQLVAHHKVSDIGTGVFPGVYERQHLQQLQGLLPAGLRWHIAPGHTLWRESELPFPLEKLPAHFTPFRKRLEQRSEPGAHALRAEVPGPAEPLAEAVLPPPPLNRPDSDAWPEHPDREKPQGFPDGDWQRSDFFAGGRPAGLLQLARFTSGSHAIARYKQTRNHPDDVTASSRLSAWLALGCVSVREVWAAVSAYEEQVSANESTYWLRFELLWREFFQWQLSRHQSSLFRLRGSSGKRTLLCFYPQPYMAWRSGRTPHPVINACMRQLNATGYLSNRCRQWAASYLVHDLGIDWRYGAAWFEQQLIDFDVASNYGNWQYIAGVAFDPRGGRAFDIDAQAEHYDPDGAFVRRWAGNDAPVMTDYWDG